MVGDALGAASENIELERVQRDLFDITEQFAAASEVLVS